jgi:hypothetical protein
VFDRPAEHSNTRRTNLENGGVDVTEHHRHAAERPQAERYYAQYADLGVGPWVPRRKPYNRRLTKTRDNAGS